MVRQSSNINNNVPYMISFVPHLAVYSFRFTMFHTFLFVGSEDYPAVSSFHFVVFHTRLASKSVIIKKKALRE